MLTISAIVLVLFQVAGAVWLVRYKPIWRWERVLLGVLMGILVLVQMREVLVSPNMSLFLLHVVLAATCICMIFVCVFAKRVT